MSHPRRVWRESVGATLGEVAEIVGVSPVKVHRWEMGAQPSVVERDRWLKALKVLRLRSEERLARAVEES